MHLIYWAMIRTTLIVFLCVDDFGVKYYNKEDANHLLSSFKNYYNINIDCNGNNYCGFDLECNYQKK